MIVSALAKPSNDTGVRWPSVPTEQHGFPGASTKGKRFLYASRHLGESTACLTQCRWGSHDS
jgi:hypothetical protein